MMTPASEEYDVYLSCPMGAVQAAQKYQEVRLQAMRIVDAFEKECNLKVFFFGRDVDSREHLEESDLAVAKILRCFNALHRSRFHVLFFPAKMTSSALAEAGFALSLRKKAIYFVKKPEHLPFLLRYSESAFPVRIHQYRTMDGLINVIKSHGERLFDIAAPSTGGGLPKPPVLLQDGGNPPAAINAQASAPDRLQELRRRLEDLSDEIESLEHLLLFDVPSSLNKMRYITEKVLHNLCIQHEAKWGQAEPTLERMLGPLASRKIMPKNVAVLVRTIQLYASPGSHYLESALSRAHAIIAQHALIEFLDWYAQSLDAGQPGRSI